jgi:hypothetical protein
VQLGPRYRRQRKSAAKGVITGCPASAVLDAVHGHRAGSRVALRVEPNAADDRPPRPHPEQLVRHRSHQPLERLHRHARHRADGNPVGGEAELGEHGLCDCWTYAHDHDPRVVDDGLVVRRVVDGGKALGEARRDLGVAR